MSNYEVIIQVVNNQENLVPVTHGVINGEEVIAVDAKELHFFLEIKTPFNKWITRRIEDYGFIDDIDFKTFLSQSNGGRPGYEYHVSLDMAKELSMVERNNKGREARKYFLEMEKKALSLEQPQIPNNFAEALQLAADQAKQLEIQAPKVEYVEKFMDTAGLFTLTAISKKLKIKRKDLIECLVRDKALFRRSKRLEPYTEKVNQGLFEIKAGEKNGHSYLQIYVTPKGCQWIAGTYISELG